MFAELEGEVKIDRYDVLEGYDRQDLHTTAMAYDRVLKEYLKEYQKTGLAVNHYPDIDAFVQDFIGI